MFLVGSVVVQDGSRCSYVFLIGSGVSFKVVPLASEWY